MQQIFRDLLIVKGTVCDWLSGLGVGSNQSGASGTAAQHSVSKTLVYCSRSTRYKTAKIFVLLPSLTKNQTICKENKFNEQKLNKHFCWEEHTNVLEAVLTWKTLKEMF